VTYVQHVLLVLYYYYSNGYTDVLGFGQWDRYQHCKPKWKKPKWKIQDGGQCHWTACILASRRDSNLILTALPRFLGSDNQMGQVSLLMYSQSKRNCSGKSKIEAHNTEKHLFQLPDYVTAW